MHRRAFGKTMLGAIGAGLLARAPMAVSGPAPATGGRVGSEPANTGTAAAGLRHFKAGDYAFIPAGERAFSSGVRADPGFALRRVRFARPVPMEQGFARIQSHIERAGRPMTALAACELRSPNVMSLQQFLDLNARYLKTMHAWGCVADGLNGPARSNVVPITEVPSEPMLFAFTYTVPESGASGDFLTSGLPDRRRADASHADPVDMARGVMAGLKAYVEELQCDWRGITAAQVYTVHDPKPVLEKVLPEFALSQIGVAWYPAWPPVTGMEFEVDVRRIRAELVM